MKRIKKFYKEHRVFTILMAIVIVCVIIITTVLIQCFYVGNGNDKYGNRLSDIDKYPITDKRINELKDGLVVQDKVKSSSIKITGRIVYISINFETNCDLVEAESIALKFLENFSEDEKSYYDFNFTLKKDSTETSDGFIISGAKNKNGSGLVWNNNRPVTNSSVEG